MRRTHSQRDQPQWPLEQIGEHDSDQAGKRGQADEAVEHGERDGNNDGRADQRRQAVPEELADRVCAISTLFGASVSAQASPRIMLTSRPTFAAELCSSASSMSSSRLRAAEVARAPVIWRRSAASWTMHMIDPRTRSYIRRWTQPLTLSDVSTPSGSPRTSADPGPTQQSWSWR